MRAASPSPLSHPSEADSSWTPEAPSWVLSLVDPTAGTSEEESGGFAVRTLTGPGQRLVSVRMRHALGLDADRFHAAVRSAYELLRERLEGSDTPHLIRVWNFIPGILAPLGELEHRYMVFNAARHEAYLGWYGAAENFATRVATASGVGHDGDDLLVHGLAAGRSGTPIENPRQVSSFCYSHRYGPLPPCFARATMVRLGYDKTVRLLVGGTASVRGEETVFVGDLGQQLDETFRNLEALVDAALHSAGSGPSPPGPGGSLRRYRNLRVYYRRADDRERVMRAATEAFGGLRAVELARADLCRDGLLVEIEGVADLTS